MNIILCVVAASIVFNVAKSDTAKEKLKHIQEKLKVVKTTLGDLKNESNFGSEVTMHETRQVYFGQKNFDDNIVNSLRHAGLLSKAVDAALKVEEKDIDIKKLTSLARTLHREIKLIGSYSEYAKDPEKAIKLQQSAFSAVGETLKDLEADLNKGKTVEQGKSEAGKAVKQNTEQTKSSAEKTTSNEKLNWIQTKLQQVITKLGSIKSGAKSYYNILHSKLLKILQFILGKNTPKEKLKFVEKKLQEVTTTLGDIKSEANASENLPCHNLNADAAEIATDAAKIVEILNDSLKSNEQQSIDEGKGKSIGEKKGITEAEKDMSEEKVKFVEEKSKEVINTHGAKPYHEKCTPKQKLKFVQEKLQETVYTEDLNYNASENEVAHITGAVLENRSTSVPTLYKSTTISAASTSGNKKMRTANLIGNLDFVRNSLLPFKPNGIVIQLKLEGEEQVQKEADISFDDCSNKKCTFTMPDIHGSVDQRYKVGVSIYTSSENKLDDLIWSRNSIALEEGDNKLTIKYDISKHTFTLIRLIFTSNDEPLSSSSVTRDTKTQLNTANTLNLKRDASSPNHLRH